MAPLARAFCDGAEKFDVFQKMKDAPGAEKGQAGEGSGKRKPSDRVIRLVEEVMSLTLIEAADLCDLCQEKLAPMDGAGAMAGRMPFPHPMGMFPGQMPMGGGMPMAAPVAAPAAAPAAAAPAEEADPAEEAAPAEDKKEAKKETVTVKLVSFDPPKKINVVKEVRALTGLGLKDSKELVEGAPKIVKKGVKTEEAEAWKEKLAGLGAEVTLE